MGVITIRVDDDFHDEMKKYAKDTGRTLTGLITVSLKKFVVSEDSE